MEDSIWNGRFDGDDFLHQRLFQRVQLNRSVDDVQNGDMVIHGFAVDEGVRRNKGRQGAKDAPDSIRRHMSNFPVIHQDMQIFDFGNIMCEDGDLEKTQHIFSEKVSSVLTMGGRSIVLGGGHEVTYGHYSGVKKAYPGKKIGIINFDAHFDNRELDPSIGATSGTGFWQIAQEGAINSLHIGIQQNSNTQKLFQTAHAYGMQYILADNLSFEYQDDVLAKLDAFISKVDVLYVTICMDVFNAAIAPGVSAAAYNGIFADAFFMKMYRYILTNNKLKALDVAEVNPNFDQQYRTARLAASLVNEWLMTEIVK